MAQSGSGGRLWKPWGDHPIVVTIIIVTSIIGTLAIILPHINKERRIEYFGRVLDNKSQVPLRAAKVSLEFRDDLQVVYTDSEGVYRFPLLMSAENITGHIQVEADKYVSYDRTIILVSTVTEFADIRLNALDVSSPSPSNTGDTETVTSPAVSTFPSSTNPITQSTTTPILILPTPSALPICSQARVKVKELSVREEAGVTQQVIQTILEGTEIEIICNSEDRQSGLYWVQIRAVLADGKVVVGWVPGQDLQ